MKKLYLLTAFAAMAACSTAFAGFDGVVKMSGSPGAFGGGPYNAKVTTANPGLTKVLDGAAGFRTFCIEYSEHISLPNSYNANLGTTAIVGSGGPQPDPISKATAWLYFHFRAGDLHTLVPTYVDNSTGNNSLQQAIWWLEQETSFYLPGIAPGGSESSFNNYLVTAAVNAIGAGTAAAARGIDANGAYGVYALNLYGSSLKDPKQSQLAIVVPEPSTVIAGALLLLPFGASTYRILRRKV
jgi:hypothetical protein